MEGKNIPPLITLSAAMVACITCIIRRAPLYNTLLIVLIVMILFYIIGCIVRKLIVKINADAEEAALKRQREEQEAAAEKLEAAELDTQEKEAAELDVQEKENAETGTEGQVVTENDKPKMSEGFGDLWKKD